MARIPLNGVSVNVEVVGEGPAVVAVHGFTGNSSTWEAFIQAACREFTVVAVDVLGHGGSDAPESPERYTMQRFAEDLVALLDSMDLDKASWLGYSMGGRICLYLALKAPQLCRALVLEGASPGISDPDERRSRVEGDAALARLIEEKGVAAFVEHWEGLPLFASQCRLPREVREKLHRQRLRNNPIGLANSLRGMGAGVQPPLQERLHSLSMPALFVAGEEDGKYCKLARSMRAAVLNGQVSIIPEAGHAPHLEQPQRFNSAVLEFLRAHRETDERLQREYSTPS